MRDSYFFVNFLVCAFKKFEEPYVILAEKTEVLDLVLEVCDALDTHTECVTGILLAVDTAEFEYVGVYHAATENLNPAGVFAERTAFAATDITADVHLGAGLGEREVRGAQTYLRVLAEHLLCEQQKNLLQVGE